MRIIHTSDWHIGKMLSDYSLIEDQRDCLFRFADRLKELHADALIVSGDLYDRSVPSAEAVSLLDSLFSYLLNDCGVEIFAAAGNHDSRERIDFGSRLMDRSGLHLVGSASRPVRSFTLHKKRENVTVWMLPYFELHHIRALYPETPMKTVQEAFDRCLSDIMETMDCSHPQILSAHGFFSTSQKESLDGEQIGGSEHIFIREHPFSYIALGHLHGCHTAGSKTVRYAGSPLKYSIDEAGQSKRFLILDFENNTLKSITEEPFSCRRDVRMIQGTLDELCDRTKQSGFDDYVFAELSDELIRVGAIQRLKSVFPNVLGLRYLNLQGQSAETRAVQIKAAERSAESLFAEFFEYAAKRPLTEWEKEYTARMMQSVKGGESDDTGTA